MQNIELNDVIIRSATIADLDKIINLLNDDSLGKNREKTISSNQIPTCYLNAFNKIKNNPNQMLVVVEYKTDIIGTLQLTIMPTLVMQGTTRAEVEGVRIKSNYRNLGLGKLLFDWVKKTAKLYDATLIQLTTNKIRTDAKRFYTSIGFEDSHVGMKMLLK